MGSPAKRLGPGRRPLRWRKTMVLALLGLGVVVVLSSVSTAVWRLAAGAMSALHASILEEDAEAGDSPPGAAGAAVALVPGGGGSLGILTSTADHALIIFSTDCGGFQAWQSELLAWSAHRVGHEAPVVRIASGCTADEEAAVRARMAEARVPLLRVHFAPSSSTMGNGKKYKYFNKPSGLLHWLEHSVPPVADDAVIALLDPDMLLMKPFPVAFTKAASSLIRSGLWANQPPPVEVSEGHPLAQHYGIGPQWLKFNRTRICGADSPCTKGYGPHDIRKVNSYFSVGPPLVARKPDFVRLARTWVVFTPRVYVEYANLLTEMFAYAMAAAHESLRHVRVDNWMISATAKLYSKLEGWERLDQAMEAAPTFICDASVLDAATTYGAANVPQVLHYCQRYPAPPIIFSKYKFQHQIFTCNRAPFATPRADAVDMSAPQVHTGSAKRGVTELEHQRNVFMACYITQSMNDALRRYKAQNC